MTRTTSSFTRHSDAFTWEMEHDPALRSTVVTIMLLDKSPDWDVLVSRLAKIAIGINVDVEELDPGLLGAPGTHPLALVA